MKVSYVEGTIADVLEIDSQVPEFETKNSQEIISQRLAGKRYLLLVAYVGSEKVGYKLGYDVSDVEFYSWSGAVLPKFRGYGIAKTLLKLQEEWAVDMGYQRVSVKSMNRFPSMMQLLISQGYQICGYENKGNPEQSKIHFVKPLASMR